MKVEIYQRHIEELLSKNGIVADWRERTRCVANSRNRTIRIQFIKGAVSYAVALHEIGHILGHGRSLRRLDKEVFAWQWAKANAKEWRKPMKVALQSRLQSYVRWAQRRRGVWLPPKSHPIWKMAGLP